MVDQPGYLYGTGDPFPRVGPPARYHWLARPGIVLPSWHLMNGNKEIGLELFATHESMDVPDILNQMLAGLNNG